MSEKISHILSRKASTHPLAALTAYDYATARLLDEQGIDILLVGDSLGMVVLGFPDTTHVTMDHMVHHISAVARAKPNALIIGDLPIHSYETPDQALENAQRLIAAGAEAIKLEGGVSHAAQIAHLVQHGIPVCAHLGMLPQSVLLEGGYRKKGKTRAQIDQLLADTHAVTAAGAFAIVLESIMPESAREITQSTTIPTIGIGCGKNQCDGEVAVITDLIGSYPWFVPPFAQPQANVAESIRHAVSAYLQSLRD